MKVNVSNTNLKEKLFRTARTARHYVVPIFLLFLVSIYGFLAWRVLALDQTQPDQAQVSAQLKTASVPHIDTDAVHKIQQLQDNSVSVQSLFDSARNNPFEE